MSNDKDRFVAAVNRKVRGWTAGPGGSMSLNEGGRAHAGDCFERGVDAHTVADRILSDTEMYLTLLVADWEDRWF